MIAGYGNRMCRCTLVGTRRAGFVHIAYRSCYISAQCMLSQNLLYHLSHNYFLVDFLPLIRFTMSPHSFDDVKWDQDKPPETMPRAQLEGVNIAMMALTCLVFLARLAVRIAQHKAYELHDLFCHFAFICYIVMWVMYFHENDPLYRAEGVQRGEIPPYPEICKNH